MAEFLFDDVFQVTAVDPDGKKFDKVSRVQAKSESSHNHQLLLDVNIELYPVRSGDKFTLALTKYIAFDANGAPVEAEQAWRGASIADKYEYVMYGRVFKFEEISASLMYTSYPNMYG